jgi:hypothetical protein
MSDIESEEYEIMDFPELPEENNKVVEAVEAVEAVESVEAVEAFETFEVVDTVDVEEIDNIEQELVLSPKSQSSSSVVLPHSVVCEYTIRDIVETPKTSYVFSTSEYCDNIKELTGEVNGRECPGFTRFTLCNKNWVHSAKMELTLTLNRDKISKNTKDASVLVFDNGLPNGVSVETDDIDEEKTDFRVITFTYSKNEHFAIKTYLAYSWTLRTLNDSEFNVELTYEPDFFQIIKNLKNSELKSVSKRHFNNALQKIYINQLKKDGNYYCEELKIAKDRIHNLDIDLKHAEDQVGYFENECESAYLRKEAAIIKNKSALQELKDMRDKLNRMKFLKDYYCSETKIAKNKRTFAENNLEKTRDQRRADVRKIDDLQATTDLQALQIQTLCEEINTLRAVVEKTKNELTAAAEQKNDELKIYCALKDDYINLKTKYDTLKDDYHLLENEMDNGQGNDIWDEVVDELKDRNGELEDKLKLMEEQQDMYKNTVKTQTSTIKSLSTVSNDVRAYKDLAKKYKTKLELKDRDIENLEDIISEYKNELNKPVKYREEVSSLKSDNKYLKNELVRLKQEYNKIDKQKKYSKWMDGDIINTLKKEITYLKGKRVNKKQIKTDIDDFHKRGYDMLDWYRHNRDSHTNEFVQFQKETEFLFNDVLNYFKLTFTQKKDNNTGEQA